MLVTSSSGQEAVLKSEPRRVACSSSPVRVGMPSELSSEYRRPFGRFAVWPPSQVGRDRSIANNDVPFVDRSLTGRFRADVAWMRTNSSGLTRNSKAGSIIDAKARADLTLFYAVYLRWLCVWIQTQEQIDGVVGHWYMRGADGHMGWCGDTKSAASEASSSDINRPRRTSNDVHTHDSAELPLQHDDAVPCATPAAIRGAKLPEAARLTRSLSNTMTSRTRRDPPSCVQILHCYTTP
ncbi:hypothetical protein IWX90DRAFT_203566 [Phyllosticta citrichinensis]|uniref:Uncharacterized protein n=1 Tax=Phyllosticta citrichinensis TaxID=1130410 RepID=A0ABR1XY13_9PEZI